MMCKELALSVDDAGIDVNRSICSSSLIVSSKTTRISEESIKSIVCSLIVA